MRRRWLFAGGGLLICIGVLIFGLLKWRSHVILSQDERHYQSATEMVNRERFDEALAVIRSGRRTAEHSGLPERRWLALEIDTLARMRHVSRLARMFQRFPDALEENEAASLLVARMQLENKNPEVSGRLRDSWKDKTDRPEAWFALEVDGMLLEGKVDEAEKLLKSRSFSGPADCGRLARLALLAARSDLERAQELLGKAYVLDPKNPEIRSFRAQVLEAQRRYAEARVEYVAAFVADPDNPFLCNQLAEFYRRQGNYGLAEQTWTSRLEPPSLDLIWLKLAFWSRVAQPSDAVLQATNVPPGDLHALVLYLLEIPPSEFWDAGRFARVFEGRRYQLSRQETFWLRLAQSLKSGREQEALRLLKLTKGNQQAEVMFWYSDGLSRYSSAPRYWWETTLRRLTLGRSGREPVLVVLERFGDDVVNWQRLADQFVVLDEV